MAYKYEMHQHTAPCSGCAVADLETLVRTMKAEGFAGCVLTDHFYHGNTGIDRSLPWTDFCLPYIESFHIAKTVGDSIGFDVLFGLEEGVGCGKEVLLYGITPDFILDHPELREGGLPLIYRVAHEAGALVVQAHPFRSRSYIPDPMARLDSEYLDGYEVWNSASIPDDNRKGWDTYYPLRKSATWDISLDDSSSRPLVVTAGSDCHCNHADVRSCISCESRITSHVELVRLLRSGKYDIAQDCVVHA